MRYAEAGFRTPVLGMPEKAFLLLWLCCSGISHVRVYLVDSSCNIISKEWWVGILRKVLSRLPL